MTHKRVPLMFDGDTLVTYLKPVMCSCVREKVMSEEEYFWLGSLAEQGGAHEQSGRSPDGSGYSAQPEPCYTVSALRASIPNAAGLYRELQHLVRLLGPELEAGRLQVPGLATLNGANAALAAARGEA